MVHSELWLGLMAWAVMGAAVAGDAVATAAAIPLSYCAARTTSIRFLNRLYHGVGHSFIQ